MPPRTDDFLSKILRHGKDTRQQVGQQIGDFFRGPEPEPPMEPTAGPSDIRSQQLYFEDLIRRQTEEDRRSGESDFPYPDEGVSPEGRLRQGALMPPGVTAEGAREKFRSDIEAAGRLPIRGR